MKFLLYLFTFLGLSQISSPQFVGLGSRYGFPFCCFACRAVISSAPLSCTSPMDMSHGHGSSPTPLECYANDDSFLTTLAFCIKERCQEYKLPTWQREKYWAESATGSAAFPAKWDYSTALQQITAAPNHTYVWVASLNQTSLVNQTSWNAQRKAAEVLDSVSAKGNKYILALVTIGFGVPILVTLIGKLPYMTGVYDKLKPYLVYPTLIGPYQARPLPWLLGNAPTLGQTFYIVGFLILNLVFTFIGYESVRPLSHPWGYDRRGEYLAYAGYRTGDIAFALLPLTILLSGRNNILLWLTNWSHSTYLLLHRWVARIFVLQTILHSVFFLVAYVRNGGYETDKNTPYWLWGIVGTVFASLMPVFSMLWARRLSYEIFLVYHIISAIFVIVGSWYHLIYRFGLTGSHEYWLYAACAVWFFDRIIRVLRVAKNGIRRSVVTDVGEHHIRVDVKGLRWSVKPDSHAYAYFPTVNAFCPWENHPFAVNSTSLFHSQSLSSAADSLHETSSHGPDIEKLPKPKETQVFNVIQTTTGITFIIRKSAGITKHIEKHASLLTLIDGPYRNNTSDEILRCDRVLLIGGGIGITGLLGWIHSHSNVKLAWGVKETASALVREIDGILSGISDREVHVGSRLDVNALLTAEVHAGWKKVGVVVCGPGELCDDVRAQVVKYGRSEKTTFELVVQAYSW